MYIPTILILGSTILVCVLKNHQVFGFSGHRIQNVAHHFSYKSSQRYDDQQNLFWAPSRPSSSTFLYSSTSSSESIPKSSSSFDLVESSEETSSISTNTEKDTEDQHPQQERIKIKRPSIHWTVPGYKVGWQDPPESGNWFDEDGPRNGPPQNYWRQRSDEKDYDRDMDLVDFLLSDTTTVGGINEGTEDAVKKVEIRNSVRKPSLSRKILGEWLPIYRNGYKVATSVEVEDKDTYPSSSPMPMFVEGPYLVQIKRTNGRKFGPRNHYGLFDLKLDIDEQITISTTSGTMNTKGQAGEGVIIHKCSDENKSQILGMDDLSIMDEEKDETTTLLVPFCFGGITYVSDYIMIMRDQDGRIDLWMRADEYYLGRNSEDGLHII